MDYHYTEEAEKGRSQAHTYNAFEQFKAALAIPNKIEAIKAVRSYTGIGLKEAKDLMEDIVARAYAMEAKRIEAQKNWETHHVNKIEPKLVTYTLMVRDDAIEGQIANTDWTDAGDYAYLETVMEEAKYHTEHGREAMVVQKHAVSVRTLTMTAVA